MNVDLRHAREDEQRRRMEQAHKDNICPFCEKNIATIHGLPITYHTYWMITDNAFPYEGTSLHKLAIYRPSHITRFEDIPIEAWTELHTHFSEYTTHTDGASLFIRFGNTGKTSSSIDHLHIHLISGNASADDPKDTRLPLDVKLGYKKKTSDA